MQKKFKPRDYQHAMINHVFGNERCALWCFMGAGKTVSVLTALDALYLAGETQPTLVIAPLRVAKGVWTDEVKKWAHLSSVEVQPIVGDWAERNRALLNGNANVFTINYENVPWLLERPEGGSKFGTVVADESTKLKSFRLRQGGKRAQALSKITHKSVKRWINLTGTPSPNGLIDLWGQTWFLDQGQRLGRTFTAFQQRWFRPKHDGHGFEPLPHAQAEIQERLSDICLSIEPKDYFDLREPIVNNIYVDLPAKARALYRDMEKKMFAEIEGHEVEAFNAASRTMKCLQLANGAAYIDEAGNWKETHDAKIQALESIIEEAAGAPVLVAYHFKSDLMRLTASFPQSRVLDSSAATLRDWNEGKIPLLFAHPASAGHGLNLQDGGNIIVFFGHWWNLEEYQQIIERIGPVRQLQAGYDRPVFIHHIIARDTMDEVVMERRESKREVQDLLLEAMKRRGACNRG